MVLRDQHPNLKPKIQAQQRQQATAADQTGIVGALRASGATGIQQFSTVSAVAAHADAAEVARLQVDPQVAAVVPDRMIPLPHQPSAATVNARSGTNPAASLCPSDPSRPLLEPEALSLTGTASTDPSRPTAQRIATGKGVKAAFLAGGMDVDNPEFVRPDGSHVIFDYQDFSGDGTQDQTGGAEPFGDASALAAQGSRVYDFATALPHAGLPTGCTFRIRGFAPDISLAAIKVFGQKGSPESGFVRGIDYAVTHDKVDVLSESLNAYAFPDGANDPISLANAAAAAAGVTVVVSSGDAGQSGTVGDPATSPDVISVGGTNAYRISALAKGYPGYVNNNITALSSGGPSLDNRYIDLVAPAMNGMAACTVDKDHWPDCSGPTQVFGGTSQACPFAAGAAALVIQAYADAHQGAKPMPQLVKQLLTGTATDLHAPADEQGSGLLDSYAAVRAAQAIGTGSDTSSALIPSTTQVDVTGAAGSVQRASVTLTNTARRPQVVTLGSRALGRQVFSTARTVQVTDAAPPQTSGPGEDPLAAPTTTFTVAPGTQWLRAEMAWPGIATSGQLSFELFDPAGRLVQASYDYGFANHQEAGVQDPTPGTWTEKVLWGPNWAWYDGPPNTPGSYRGPVHLQLTGFDHTSAGIGPQTKIIPGGSSATFDVAVPLPDQAGDAPASLQVDSGLGTRLSVPLARRTLVPAPGTFTATITGGVGRGIDQYLGYYLDVPAGQPDMTVDVTAPDPNTMLAFYLATPDGQILASDVNQVESSWGSGHGPATGAATMVVNRPAAGRWLLIAQVVGNVSGNDISEQVHGTVRFGSVRVSATGLPAGAPLSASRTASVTVTNTGAAGAYFFLDPRLDQQADLAMKPTSGNTTLNLPEDTATTSPPSWLVPPHTGTITETVHASLPVGVYLGYVDGNPSVHGSGSHVVLDVSAGQVAFGQWSTDIGELGPFHGTAAPGTATATLTARTQAFDPAVMSSTGDFWLSSVGGPAGAPVFIPAGGKATLPLTIKPTAAPGSTVHGTVYVDTWNNLAGQGCELTGLPYSYRVG
ncbi:subtilase family protein [Kutzneria buriramensis]|uniref:Subtilase family protein n=1 Tax=Kutzneria buriramensis TaxID=1045776 RepID=A0A3E0G6S6_9PSEU|nr:subtilase family protein [Kutzneria buriramensis]